VRCRMRSPSTAVWASLHSQSARREGSRDGCEARRLLASENRSKQLSLLPSDFKRYGIVLDPAFHEYLRDNPVRLPLTLMRRFHARPLFWDAASYLLYRCWSAKTPSPFRPPEEHLEGARRLWKRNLPLGTRA
jgi:hypothetical protein